jgi:hypothetical protein
MLARGAASMLNHGQQFLKLCLRIAKASGNRPLIEGQLVEWNLSCPASSLVVMPTVAMRPPLRRDSRALNHDIE